MITADEARMLFQYMPDSGLIFWKVNASYRVKAGDPAGCINKNGYQLIRLRGRQYKAHRIIWLIMTGSWPENVIDHINGVCGDNRWSNLRVVSTGENLKNKKINSNNKSGTMGVSWDRRANKWYAKIRVNGRLLNLGNFDDINKAIEVRKLAEINHGFHENHGRLK